MKNRTEYLVECAEFGISESYNSIKEARNSIKEFIKTDKSNGIKGKYTISKVNLTYSSHDLSDSQILYISSAVKTSKMQAIETYVS